MKNQNEPREKVYRKVYLAKKVDEDEEEYTFRVFGHKNIKINEKDIVIGGVKTKVIIDAGATYNVLSVGT